MWRFWSWSDCLFILSTTHPQPNAFDGPVSLTPSFSSNTRCQVTQLRSVILLLTSFSTTGKLFRLILTPKHEVTTLFHKLATGGSVCWWNCRNGRQWRVTFFDDFRQHNTHRKNEFENSKNEVITKPQSLHVLLQIINLHGRRLPSIDTYQMYCWKMQLYNRIL